MVRTSWAFSLGTGFLVLTGWAFGIEQFKSIFTGLATMKPFTAIGFMLLGFCLWNLKSDSQHNRIIRCLAVAVCGIGVSFFGTYLGLWNLSYDSWIFPDAVRETGEIQPGRMSPATALGFMILSVSVFLFTTESGKRVMAAQYGALGGTILGLVPLIGYLYGVESLYRFNFFSTTALHTAGLFSLLGMSLLFLRPKRGFMATVCSLQLGGRLARRSLALVFTAPFLMGWLALKGQQFGWFGSSVGLALLITTNVVFFAVLIWMAAASLNRTETERHKIQQREKLAQTKTLQAQAEHTRTLETISDAFVALDRDWRFIYVNAQAAEIYGMTSAKTNDAIIWTAFPEIETLLRADCEKAMHTQKQVVLETYFTPVKRWLEIRLNPATDRLAIFFHDITRRKRSEAMNNGQRQVLEKVARGEPLEQTLDALLLFIESMAPDMIGSILLLDDDGKHVRHGSAPSLPKAYTNAIDGLAIGPSTGSCGTAMYRQEPVFVTDISRDPLWTEYRDIAATHGLQSCWSTPIFDAQNQLLGSFAIYHREPTTPTNQHRELITLATDISAICITRERSEEALRASEERYARAIQGTSDGIWDWNIISNHEYLSPRWKELLGFSDEELPNHADSFYNRIHPEDRPHVEAAIKAHLEHHTPYDVELRLKTKSGAYRWFRTRGQAEWDENGTAHRMAGSLSDINTRKEAQTDLEREKAQATTVLNSLSSHIAVVDREGTIVAVNEAWSKFAEENNAASTASVQPGANYLDVVSAAASQGDRLAELVHDGIHQVLSGKRSHFELEYPCDSPTQTRRFLMIVTAMKNGDGAVLAHENITERSKTQEALRDSAEFNRQVIAGANEGIVVLNRELRYTVWNPFMVKLLGLTTDQVLGKHPLDLFPWVKEGGQLAAIERALQGETIVLPDSQRLKTGAKRISWLHARLAPLRDANNQIVGVISIISDITERKQNEAKLRSSYSQLRALTARLRSIREEQSARIAREIHDVLGQQLTALKLDLAWFKRRTRDVSDANLQNALRTKLRESSELIDSTIHTVQKVSTELRPGLLDKLGLTAALNHECKSFSSRTGIPTHLDIQENEPSIDQKRSIEIFRVFQELLTNIARHAKAKKVSVTLRRDRDLLVLEVQDNGIGITEHQITASQSLGLLGMKERAQILNGSLEMTGKPGKGTLSRLILPLDPDDENTDR